jgi:hypothetical protein
MKLQTTLKSTLLSPLFLLTSLHAGVGSGGPNSCTINDECADAIYINTVYSDVGFVYTFGCNLFAAPDTIFEACQMGDYPTVWYRMTTDQAALVMNVEVHGLDFQSPIISLFESNGDCSSMQPIYLTEDNMTCVIGSGGIARVVGLAVNSNTTYFIAVSSYLSIGGAFELGISTKSKGFSCVADRQAEIVSRSNGGPLEGPFDPNETVRFCFNVNSFTATNNGCQWFQGIVPTFGNGWDPSSFDSLGQPLNATINGDTVGELYNGLYGASTWDWFNTVDYHHDLPYVTIGDLDGNGTLDMCNSLYESDCPAGGVTGACCNPCWNTPGSLLPPGWFAYGINGSCPDPGPPVGVDWGDGNTCGGGMGPWKMCFDLTTRDIPDCMTDSTSKDLSIGFFTFSDGETGAWTGEASVCANDVPLKLSLQAKCGRISIQDTEQLTPLCSGDTLQYVVEESGVSHWEWNISPHWAVPYLTNNGENGFLIQAPLLNNTGHPVDVQATLIGYYTGSTDKIVKKFTFKLDDQAACESVSTGSANESKVDSGKLRVFPVPANESVVLEWSFDLEKDAILEIYNAQGILQELITLSTADRNQKRIYTSAWPQGVYMLSLSNGKFKYIARMAKY